MQSLVRACFLHKVWVFTEFDGCYYQLTMTADCTKIFQGASPTVKFSIGSAGSGSVLL
jgi:hypothetical protein